MHFECGSASPKGSLLYWVKSYLRGKLDSNRTTCQLALPEIDKRWKGCARDRMRERSEMLPKLSSLLVVEEAEAPEGIRGITPSINARGAHALFKVALHPHTRFKIARACVRMMSRASVEQRRAFATVMFSLLEPVRFFGFGHHNCNVPLQCLLMEALPVLLKGLPVSACQRVLGVFCPRILRAPENQLDGSVKQSCLKALQEIVEEKTTVGFRINIAQASAKREG